MYTSSEETNISVSFQDKEKLSAWFYRITFECKCKSIFLTEKRLFPHHIQRTQKQLFPHHIQRTQKRIFPHQIQRTQKRLFPRHIQRTRFVNQSVPAHKSTDHIAIWQWIRTPLATLARKKQISNFPYDIYQRSYSKDIICCDYICIYSRSK